MVCHTYAIIIRRINNKTPLSGNNNREEVITSASKHSPLTPYYDIAYEAMISNWWNFFTIIYNTSQLHISDIKEVKKMYIKLHFPLYLSVGMYPDWLYDQLSCLSLSLSIISPSLWINDKVVFISLKSIWNIKVIGWLGDRMICWLGD